jgi:hypothetical protein
LDNLSNYHLNRAMENGLTQEQAAEALSTCSQVPPTSSAVISPVPPGAARIWIYRNDGPYETSDRPYPRLNGHVAGIVEPNGAFYRDVPPGHYAVTVDSYGVPYPNQFTGVDLAAGETADVKVLSMREKVGGGEYISTRARFFTQLVPADVAQAGIAVTPFYGKG